MSNNDRISRALDALCEGIRPVCEVVWAAAYGDGWLEQVHSNDRAAVGFADANDLTFLLKGMHNTWQEVWRHRLGQAERAYTSELRDTRNRWAHGGKFSTDDTYRMLDTAERLLTSVSAIEQANLVQALKRDLQRQIVDLQASGERRKSSAKATEGEPLQGLAPWRSIVTPHADVASGNFEHAEFSADLYQVATGNAEHEYQDPVAFFSRTYLTRGLVALLKSTASRLSGRGGAPVIDLQTNFGGGKSHSMIALYHMASGLAPGELPGIGEMFAEHDLALPSRIARAVVVGQWISPASPSVKADGTTVHTIWGEIAYQLAGIDGYKLVEAEDLSGSNPGKKLIDLFRLAGPSIVLIDEWVAYARQLPSRDNEPALIGGHFDTQFTFAQALTEAAAAVPDVVILVSIPESAIEVGGDKGQAALDRLTHVVRRTSEQWKSADDDESFEIVRRRLFEPMTPENARARDGVIKAFCDFYRQREKEFPSEVTEKAYRHRMELSYPVHPELFDRLYKDWSTLDRFQRTRGVLRLMATLISALWQSGDQNLLIMPGTIPLDAPRVNSEITKYLDDVWDAVISSDVDGPNALPLRLDKDNAVLGRYSATRRVARAVFLASAPRARDEAHRGIDLKLITLGVAQPGESPGTFADALRRLSGDATYLYVDGAQYWYSLRMNIIRLASDRANSNFTDDNADDEIKRRLQAKQALGPFTAVHAFPDGPGDITDDDDGVHLVVLPARAHHVPNSDVSPAITNAAEILSQRNAGPRLNRNMLIFCAASEARLVELRTVTRQYLAWKSILEDAKAEKFEATKADESTAAVKLSETDDTVKRQIAETYQHILVPEQTPGTPEIRFYQTKPSGTGTLAERVAKKLGSEERLISAYGGTRIRMDLDRVPLWSDQFDINVAELWKAYCRYPYLPRLANFEVLARAISDGVSKMAWQSETFAYAEARDGDRWLGLKCASHVDARPSGLLVHPTEAQAQFDAALPETTGSAEGDTTSGQESGGKAGEPKAAPKPGVADPKTYYGQFKLDPVRAGRQLSDILPNIVDQLAKVPGADVTITLEINASSDGYDEKVRRVVTENGNQLGCKSQEFE